MDGFIKIYRVVNGATEELKEVTLSKRSYWHHELGGIDYVMLFFSLDSDNLAVTTPFKEGDFIINPINGDKYFIMDLAVPNENNSGFWDFQLRFDSIVTALSRNICKYTLQGGIPELSWKLTDSMSGNSVLKQAILGSLAHDDITQSGNWVIDTTTYAADIDFAEQFTYAPNGEKYTELFDKICENYGCEWWNVKSGNDNIIYFGIAKTPEGTEVEFVDTETNALAHQLQIISTSTQKSGEDYATKLYYRGSERNVPRNYDLTTGVKRAQVSYLNDSRLPLPDNTPFIASSDFADKPHACIELYETNDKIYPRRLEYVTQVLYYKGENDAGDEQRFYCVKTDNPVATLADFKVDASKGNLSIAFSSGSLNGRNYEVQLHKTALSRATVYNLDGTPFEGNKSGCWYEIVTEGGDNYTPNEFLYPAVGDECQLFNWSAYNTTTKRLTAPMLKLIADARAELYAAAQERFAEICVLNTSFTCVPAKVGTPSSMLLSIGQSVNVHTAPVLVGASFISRIRAVEVMLYNANDRTYTVGIGAKYSRLGRIINSLRENREDLKNVEDEVNNQTNPTTYVIREKSGFQAVRLKQDGTFIPHTLSFEVFGVTGRTEVNYTDRSSMRIKFDNGAWIAPDVDGNFQVSGDFQTITAAAFTDESLEVLRASMVLHKIEDGSRAAALVISNPLQIIEVNEDWDVGYAFADDTDSYETDIYCFSKGGNLPMTDIDIFLEATNGTKVAIVTDGVAIGNTTINGAPIRVTFIVQNNKGHLSVVFTNAAVEQLFTIPVLVGITALVDGATSEISQTANIVFRQKGVDGTDGTDGSAASVRKLIVSPDYIVSDAEGNLISRQITFSGQIVVGDGLPSVLPDAKFKAIIDGSAVSGNITSPYTLPVSCQTVVIEMYDETGLTLLDSQSIPIVQQGRVGKDAVTVILSNENHTLSLEDDRDVINYSGSGTSVKLVTAEYEFIPKDYSSYPEDERWQHLRPGEFFVHAAGTDITVGTRSILGNSFAFGNASNLVGGTTGDRAAYIDFTIYFRAVGEIQINYVTKRQNFSVAPSGFNVAIITLYKRSAEELAANDFTAACAAATPDPITAIRYNFITKALSTLPAGWTSIMPRTNEAALWAVQATARSRTDEDSIAVTEFSAPTKVLPSGINQAITVWSEYDGYLDEDADMIEITDENGLHVISNNMELLNLDENDDNNDSISDIGVLIFVELDKTTLTEVKRHNIILSRNDSTNAITYREFTKAISGTTTNQDLAAFLNSVGGNEQDGFNFVTVSAYGDCKEAFKAYTSLRDNLDSLGIARFAFDEEETTFAAIGKPGLIYGAGILAIDTWYTSATVFIENGNFANSVSQLHSETVELFCRATDADIDNGIVHAPTGTVRFSFLTHRIISGSTSPWSQDFPEPDASRTPCYRIHATALSASDTDDILPTEWSEPERFVIDGSDAISVDLDNENDSMLYSASKGLLSGNVISNARLFVGVADKSDSQNCSWQITAVGCTLLVNGSSVTSSTNRNIVVNGMTAATAKVTATATYTDEYNNQIVKSAVLTLKRIIDRDKYDIKLYPNAVFYNKNLSYATKQIAISANKIAADGTKTESITLNSAGIYVAAYYKANASANAGWSQVGNAFSVTETLAAANDNILFELRKVKEGKTYSVSDATTYTVEDYETIPINKAENGAKTAIVSLYKRSATALTKSDFYGDCCNATGVPDETSSEAYLTYSFVTKLFSILPVGWTQTPPSADGNALYVVQATAQSQTDTDTIKFTEFSDPEKVLPNGLNTVLTAHSSTTYNRTSNQLALTIVDEDGTHTTQNGFAYSSTRPDSATSGALKVFELDPSTLDVLSTKIINIYTANTVNEINTYLSSIANDSIVAVCAYGNVVPMFSKYTGASGLDNFLGTLGCPRFRLSNGSNTVATRETFAFIGGKFVTPGAGILAISAGSVDVSVFIKDGVFVNGQTQLKSETVTLYGRFVNKAAAITSYNSIGTLTYNFNIHSLTSTPTGWSQEFPEADSRNYPCFMIQATASNVNDIDEILGSEWSAPQEYVKNGESAPNFVWSSAYIQVNLDKDNHLINDIVSEVLEAYIGGSLKNVNSVLRLEVDGTTAWNGSSWVVDEASSLGVEDDDPAPLWISGGRMYLGFTFKPTRTETPGTVKTLTCYFTLLDANGVAKTYSSSIKLKFNTGNYPGENATKLELIANKTANLPFLASIGSGHYTNFYLVASYTDPTSYTFYADYTGYNFCVKRYNGENQALFTNYDGITVKLVGNFTTRTVDAKYNSEPSSPDKRTNYLYIQDGNLYVHIGAIPGERCVYSNGSYIIFPPSSVGVVVNVGDLSISTVLSVDYTAIWSEIKVTNDEISSSIYTLSGEFSQIQQRSDLISLKVGNEKTQQRINLLSNAFINRVFETSSSASDSYEISKVRLEANHWYILSAEAFEADTRKELAAYLNLATSYMAYYTSVNINGSYRAAVKGFSNVLFERKATLFKMGSTTMETNVFGYAPSGYARKSVLKYAQIEDVTDIVNKINPTSYELSQGQIAGASFDEFASVMASPYSLGPEDYSVNASLVLSPKCYTHDSTGNSDSMTTETVTLPNGTKATAYDLTFNNATGSPNTNYYKELEALSNSATVLSVGKTYTMSFWAKGSPASIDNAAVYMNIANFFYPAAAPETTLSGTTYKAYGYQAIKATELSISKLYWKIDSATWKFYQITFTVLSGHTTDYCIFLRNYGGTLKIACPKLELGGRATEFNDGVSIRELLATGIDIRDGIINLIAGKVNFIDNSGNVNTKVQIDPTDGTLRAVGGIFSGFVKRTRTVISQNNQAVYIDDTWGTPVINFQKTGSFIDLYGWSEAPNIGLPIWSSRIKELSSYQALSAAQKQAYKDDICSYIGTKLLIYNRSGYSMSFVTNLTNTSYGQTLSSGRAMYLECVAEDEPGDSTNENIYWKVLSNYAIVAP